MSTLHLEDREVDYVMQVLQTRPYGEVAQLINKLVQQLNEQRGAPTTLVDHSAS